VSAEPETLLTTSRFEVVRLQVPTPDGGVRAKEVIRHPGAVCILPMVDDRHVCLIKNRRAAIGETLIELPAGTLEPPETPAQTAARELLEETGYRAERLARLHEFFLSPGILDERMHLYLATGLTEGDARREPTEQITNLVLAWEDAIALVYDEQIHDAKTIIGLLYYDQLRGRQV
jgi:ADP-ribose pyrophosphatase